MEVNRILCGIQLEIRIEKGYAAAVGNELFARISASAKVNGGIGIRSKLEFRELPFHRLCAVIAEIIAAEIYAAGGNIVYLDKARIAAHDLGDYENIGDRLIAARGSRGLFRLANIGIGICRAGGRRGRNTEASVRLHGVGMVGLKLGDVDILNMPAGLIHKAEAASACGEVEGRNEIICIAHCILGAADYYVRARVDACALGEGIARALGGIDEHIARKLLPLGGGIVQFYPVGAAEGRVLIALRIGCDYLRYPYIGGIILIAARKNGK